MQLSISQYSLWSLDKRHKTVICRSIQILYMVYMDVDWINLNF